MMFRFPLYVMSPCGSNSISRPPFFSFFPRDWPGAAICFRLPPVSIIPSADLTLGTGISFFLLCPFLSASNVTIRQVKNSDITRAGWFFPIIRYACFSQKMIHYFPSSARAPRLLDFLVLCQKQAGQMPRLAVCFLVARRCFIPPRRCKNTRAGRR